MISVCTTELLECDGLESTYGFSHLEKRAGNQKRNTEVRMKYLTTGSESEAKKVIFEVGRFP